MSKLALSAIVVLLLSVASPAIAQESGGSFGGGDFSSSGGGGGGGDFSSSGGGGDFSSSGGFGSSGSDLPSSVGGGGIGGLACVLLVMAIVMFGVIMKNRRRGPGMGSGPGSGSLVDMVRGGGGPGVSGYSGHDAVHCIAISLGVDWRARAEIQRVLAELARTANLGSPEGRSEALREAVLALRRAEIAWLYAGPATPTSLHISAAQGHFQSLGNGLRSRFRTEVVRGTAGGVRSNEGPEMTAKREEGQGTVVVSVVVCARRPLVPVNSPDAGAVRSALDALSTLTPRDLVAMEIIWSPAAENDRMSTGELEQNYPEMRLIDPNSIAGRVFCVYCSGPFPMELLNCPHCGAPALDSKDNRAPKR